MAPAKLAMCHTYSYRSMTYSTSQNIAHVEDEVELGYGRRDDESENMNLGNLQSWWTMNAFESFKKSGVEASHLASHYSIALTNNLHNHY